MLAAIWQIRMSAGKQVPGTVKFTTRSVTKLAPTSGSCTISRMEASSLGLASGSKLGWELPFTDVVKATVIVIDILKKRHDPRQGIFNQAHK